MRLKFDCGVKVIGWRAGVTIGRKEAFLQDEKRHHLVKLEEKKERKSETGN